LLLFIEGSDPSLALVFVAAACALLYREILIGVALSVPIVRKLGFLLYKRAEKVEQQKHCACCGAIPIYMVTTCASATCEGPVPSTLTLLVCREHHPNPKIGQKAHELHTRIAQIHPEITIERIYSHNPYSY
jgi:hypothetical protein